MQELLQSQGSMEYMQICSNQSKGRSLARLLGIILVPEASDSYTLGCRIYAFHHAYTSKLYVLNLEGKMLKHLDL